LAVVAGGDPAGKSFQLATVVDGRNAAQVKPGVASELLDAGWKIGGQWRRLVVRSQPSVLSCQRRPHPPPKGYHFTADRVQLPTARRPLTTGM
jgi:hypothetical protein